MDTVSSRLEAQQRVDRVTAFQQELSQLEYEQVLVLTEQQQQKLDDYHRNLLIQLSQQYDVDLYQPAKKLTLGMQLASLLGALALASSIFFLFYQYWGFFDTAAQVTILITAPLVTFIASGLISRREQTGYFAKLMALISMACFILNLNMLGQIFNIPPSANALLAWCLYAGVLAYLFDSRLLLAIAIGFSYSFIAAQVSSWFGFYWLSMGNRLENFILPAVLVFVIPSLFPQQQWQGFATVYRVLGGGGLLVILWGLGYSGQASYINGNSDVIEGCYQVLGFIVSASLIALGIARAWPAVVNTGSLFFIFYLFTKFCDWWWELMPKYLFFLILGLTALLFLFIFSRLREQMKQKQQEIRA
ncbi:DUF2157 domain-containing protein [Endozoicomonas sp. Mp262]|uniref:DUF2157 domain-containing protein n=1 Tax=Endozoicomonas sp. Mp262 TaxID=2919499 RepID=UPI0021D9B6A3